jgi:16S rRNA (cytosine967-C5)-methyltransferase
MLELQQVQLRLLSDVARVLRPGGVLVYSTCTTEPEENEQVIEKFLSLDRAYRIETVSPYLPEDFQSFVTHEGFLHIDPPQQNVDGFFGARLVKVS